MRRRAVVGMWSLLLSGLACSSDRVVSPERGTMVPEVSRAGLPGASAYTATGYWVEGWFADVNNKNQIVGMANGRPVSTTWGGGTAPPLYYMATTPGITGKAVAVNTYGMIVGAITSNCCQWADLFPAFWLDQYSYPKVLSDTGEAADVNDMGHVVGYVMKRGVSRAFFWDVRAGTVELLPPFTRGRASAARAINNDQVILGEADLGNGLTTVIWRRSGTGWTVKAVTGGIFGLDLDHGIGIVGHTNNTASYGYPDHAGTFNVLGFSYAEAVSPSAALVAGWDAGAATGWPVSTVAFIADRQGNTTYLPWPVAGTWRDGFGQGVNDCGLVVGTGYPLTSMWQPFTAQPLVWDPGC